MRKKASKRGRPTGRKITPEVILKYKNKINGSIYYSTNHYETVVREGNEFLPVFEKLVDAPHRRIVLVSKSALERVSH